MYKLSIDTFDTFWVKKYVYNSVLVQMSKKYILKLAINHVQFSVLL